MPSETVIRRALTPVVGALFAILFVGGGSLAAPPAEAQPSQRHTAMTQGADASKARVTYVQSCTSDMTHKSTADEVHATADNPGSTPRFLRSSGSTTTRHFSDRSAPLAACRAPPG